MVFFEEECSDTSLVVNNALCNHSASSIQYRELAWNTRIRY